MGVLSERGPFVPCRSAGNTFRLHADADVRVGLSAERLSLVQARLSRHPNFATPLPGSEHAGHVAVTRIDRLSVAPAGTVVTLLGTLTQAGRSLWGRSSLHLLRA